MLVERQRVERLGQTLDGPEGLAPLEPEAVECARLGQEPERALREARALDELDERHRGRPVLRDETPFGFVNAFHKGEPHADGKPISDPV